MVVLMFVIAQAIEAAAGICCGGKAGLDEQFNLAGKHSASLFFSPCFYAGQCKSLCPDSPYGACYSATEMDRCYAHISSHGALLVFTRLASLSCSQLKSLHSPRTSLFLLRSRQQPHSHPHVRLPSGGRLQP